MRGHQGDQWADNLGNVRPAMPAESEGNCGYAGHVANGPAERGFLNVKSNSSNETKGAVLQGIEYLEHPSVREIMRVSGLSRGAVDGCLNRCLTAKSPSIRVVGRIPLFPNGTTRLFGLLPFGEWWLEQARFLGYVQPRQFRNGVAHGPESIVEETEIQATSSATGF